MISMKRVILTACATMLITSPALANETYICTHGAKERHISVVYANEGQAVPCEVTYTKGTGTQSLWRAENKVGYCEEKAAAFVEKQRSWGWDCTKQDTDSTMEDKSMMKDDMQEKAQDTMETM